ncbi:alpha-E domain-containing protein [Desulfovibrio aerotolerans]|uniref:Alpha-E domain-containing protein n=1 Tax=Solidesulfovibrio aerotolerans TaxID=295255 RepID=A0A7C9IKT5_9BACT|nr:alpha-E domain-containing protein [Solidesulfovibrio aerotolerans]MYL83125.1 alpha-E domain-containing protein [Solidesulfovibrio aerotolerans]
MLSRVAEAIYWMSRYLERAENIARFLDVNWHLTLDTPGGRGEQWMPLVSAMGDHSLFVDRELAGNRKSVIRFLAFDPEYPNSIVNCLARARDNARTIREIIPTEMWEQTNTFYHMVREAARDCETVLNNPYQFCDEVKRRDLTISGIAGDAMSHDEAWDFFRLGRLLERADKTSRILDVKYFILLPHPTDIGSNLDYVQWGALLKAISALEAYRRRHGRIQPERIVEFLLLDHDFPRSVLCCLIKAQECLHAITGTPAGYFANPAEKRIGLLTGDLAYSGLEEIFSAGLHEFTDNLQTRMNLVDTAIYDTFFSTFPAIDAASQQ